MSWVGVMGWQVIATAGAKHWLILHSRHEMIWNFCCKPQMRTARRNDKMPLGTQEYGVALGHLLSQLDVITNPVKSIYSVLVPCSLRSAGDSTF